MGRKRFIFLKLSRHYPPVRYERIRNGDLHLNGEFPKKRHLNGKNKIFFLNWNILLKSRKVFVSHRWQIANIDLPKTDACKISMSNDTFLIFVTSYLWIVWFQWYIDTSGLILCLKIRESLHNIYKIHLLIIYIWNIYV